MKLTWNFYSGIVAPILTLTAAFILVLFATDQLYFSLYYFPFILLGMVMVNVLLFWSSYLLYIRKKISKRLMIRSGKLSIKLGQFYLIVLLIMSLLKLISNFLPFHLFDYEADNIYWLISIWTFIEIIHHYFYKLIYDKKKAFFEIVSDENKNGLTSPTGGAIGIAVKKLER
jgi:hypothetical protein